MRFFDKLIDSLNRHKVAYSLVGGYAVSLHGAPRGTVDIDCIIDHSEQQFVAIEKALNSIGLESKLPISGKEVFHSKLEFIKQKGLIAWSFFNPKNPLECVDIIITHNKGDYQSVELRYGEKFINVIALEDLIEMKRLSNRPQDIQDIKVLEIIYERKNQAR